MTPTNIEWVTNPDGSKGETWNPVTGCTKISAGCAHCYAEAMTRRFWDAWDCERPPRHFEVILHEERLDQVMHWKKPRTIFVCSMSDLFHEDVPREFIKLVYGVTLDCPQHTFKILTKRPERMCEFSKDMSGWAPNVHLGVTCENQDNLWRVEWLRKTPTAMRFVSAEPLLSAIDFGQLSDPNIHQIIVGAETGPGKRPMELAWARSIRDQCKEAGVSFFFKRDSQGLTTLDGHEHKEQPK